MLRTKMGLLLNIPKFSYHEIIRKLRGASTIPIKFQKPLIKPKKDYNFSDKEFKKYRDANKGIAYAYRCKSEAGMKFDMDDSETFDDIELERVDPGQKEAEVQREEWSKYRKQAFYKTKRLHFKSPHQPSMLTYIEKQQIRALNKKDSDYWNCEKLATCFPATPEIIKKVLKSQFTFFKVEKILIHDENVRKNWELFSKGQLGIDEKLAAHLKKFIGRHKLQPDPKEVEKYLPPTPDFSLNLVKTEFGSIISTSKKYKDAENKKLKSDEQNRFTIDKVASEYKVISEDKEWPYRNVHYTIDEFYKKIEAKGDELVEEVDGIILKQRSPKQLNVGEEVEINAESYAYLQDSNTVHVDKDRNLESVVFKRNEQYIPQRVHIPKALRQKGKLFRVRDCFYNDLGFFLYKVPGLFS